MSEPNSQKPSSSKRSYWPAAAAIAALVILLAAAAYAGFVLGQSSAAQIAAEVTLESHPATTTPPSPQPDPTSEPTAATTAVETATQTQVVEKIVPQDLPAAAETSVPTTVPAETDSDRQDANDEAIDLTVFHEVWRLIESEFDGELPEDNDLLYEAIGGSLNALDDNYTRFIRPEIAERLRDDLDGSVSGIGAIVRPHDDGLVEIVRPIDGQPADLAGLLAGDLIVEVDGQSVGSMSFDEFLLLVRGPEGTAVTLSIVRKDVEEPIEFSLIRAEFEVPVVETQVFEEDAQTVAYVRLSSFTKSAEEDLSSALAILLAQNPDGIILDLRDNGGGFLDQAVAVADLFLPEGVVLYERSSKGELDETFRSESGDFAEDLPLVVLVNAGSASASEIVAGAIQDNGRGILVGEPTFGKGSVQHVHTLSDGSELRVTIARWFTPNNRSISEEGVLPDLEVATPEDLGGDDDEQLQRAIDYLLNGD